VALTLIPFPWSKVALLGYVGLFLGTFWGGVLAFVPSPAMALVVSAGQVLDPTSVAIVAGIGFTCGEIVLFGVIRRLPESSLPHWIYPAWVKVFFARIEPSLLWWPVIYIVAIVPTPAFDLVTIWSARARVPLWKYSLPIFAGRATRSYLLAIWGTTSSYIAYQSFLKRLFGLD
jgi:uncharacterized membrane protein YdjX (TVP38/TMEM64 family)